MIARGGAVLALALVAVSATLVGASPSSSGSPAAGSVPPAPSIAPPDSAAGLIHPISKSPASSSVPIAGWIKEPVAPPNVPGWGYYGSQAVYDPAAGYLLAFGPQTTAGAALPDYVANCVDSTWALEDNQWVNLSIAGPTERCGALMGYDASAGYVVLFGGDNYTSGELSDTWTFQNGTWMQVQSLHHPNLTYEGMDSMIYDPELGCMLLFGIASNGNSAPTWEFCDGQWTETLASGPPIYQVVGVGPPLGYDGADGCAMLVGLGPNGWADNGSTNYTYELCPGRNWTVVSTYLPVEQEGGTLAWDPALSGVALFGGIGRLSTGASSDDLNETWLFTGGRWSPLTINGPPSRGGGILTFDTETNTLILTGGYGSYWGQCKGWCNDTWELGPPAADIAASIAVVPAAICVQSQPDCTAYTTSARVSLQLSVSPANSSDESGASSTGARAVYGPYNWINAPNLTFLPFGSIELASRPDVQQQCVDVVAGSSSCPTLPTIHWLGSRESLVWSWSTGGPYDALHIGDSWSVEFNVSASGGPFTKVPVDACVTIGCEQAGSAPWEGAFSSVSFNPFENSSVSADSWPLAVVQVITNPPSYTSPSPVSPGVPPGTGSPLPAPIAPAPVPVTVPVAFAPSVLASAGPSFTAAAAGILAAGGTRVLLRPRSMGQAILARVSRGELPRGARHTIRGSD